MTASNQIEKTGSLVRGGCPSSKQKPILLHLATPGQLIHLLLLVLVEVRVCDSQGGVLHLQPGGLPGLLLHRSALLIAVDLASD